MRLSVVIPTRNRREQLLRTLAALDAQDVDPARAELVVCDNASTDGTLAALQAWTGRLPLVVLSEPREGASMARNRALAAAGGDVVLLLGDDMVPAGARLLAGHLAAHAEQSEDSYGVLGRIDWAEPVSPFMRWTERAGFQFAYHLAQPGEVDVAKHLYSSHTSFKRAELLAAGGFDERFPYLMEDIELGIRLARRGMRLDHRPELRVLHHHEQTLTTFAPRLETTGAAAALLHSLYPGEAPAEILGPTWKWPLYPPSAAIARMLLRAGVSGTLRDKAWTAIVMARYRRGWRRAATR
jgi:glycosyltransferase involved in cell wall biosynthesis